MSGSKSLVLITVDCLRADHTGFMGYSRPTTPFLDELAAESLVFPKAIVVGAPTYYSFPGIMASRYPLALGREVFGVPPGEPTLASVLQQAGYRSAAYVAANPYLAGRFGYAQGFEVFDDFLSRDLPEVDGPLRSPGALTRFNDRIAGAAHAAGPLGKLYDELYFQYCLRIAASKTVSWESLRRFPAADILVDHACEWLKSIGKQPFFLWLHFMDPHAPYYPTPEALAATGAERIDPVRGRYVNAAWTARSEAKLDKFRDEIVQLYDAGIRWIDTKLARLAETMRQLSIWDSSLFVLTADHGEEFLDHGGRFHPSSRAYQEILHVPLLMRIPGLTRRPLSDAPFSHLHLAPTILDAMDIEPPAAFEGRSHWKEAHRGEGWEWAISESIGRCANPMDARRRVGGRVLAVQDCSAKLVIDFDDNREELFDLGSDAGEHHAIPAGSDKARRARLLSLARQHVSHVRGEVDRERAIRARVHEIGLEWKYPVENGL